MILFHGVASSPVVWFELGTRDAARQQRFYADAFQWDFRRDASFAGHSIITTGDRGIRGGLWNVPADLGAYACFYAEVADVDAAVASAVRAGGTEILIRREGPGGLQFAHVADPEGNRIGVFQP